MQGWSAALALAVAATQAQQIPRQVGWAEQQLQGLGSCRVPHMAASAPLLPSACCLAAWLALFPGLA